MSTATINFHQPLTPVPVLPMDAPLPLVIAPSVPSTSELAAPGPLLVPNMMLTNIVVAPRRRRRGALNKKAMKASVVPTIDPSLRIQTQRKVATTRKTKDLKIEAPVAQIPVSLWDSQKECHARTMTCFSKYLGGLNTSVMGAGKTYLSFAAALDLKLDMIVICPAPLVSLWRKKAAEAAGVTLIDCVSYRSLIGSGKVGCKHRLLTKIGTSFIPTEYFTNALRKGVLIVADEVASIKNNATSSHEAFHALSREAANLFHMSAHPWNRSRILALSATPYEKIQFTASMYQSLGLVRSSNMHIFNQQTKEYELTGMSELLATCNSIDQDTTSEITSGFYSNKKTNKWCWDLYKKVIKPVMVFSAPKPPIAAQFFAYNGYYEMPLDEVNELRIAVDMLKKALRFNDETGGIRLNANSISEVTKALQAVAKAKLKGLARVTRQKFTEDPTSKVILALEYKDHIATLCSLLADFSPKVLNGDVKDEVRQETVSSFQEANLTTRLLIVHPQVGGVGLSLDDIHGNFKRTTWYIPTYRFIDLVQTSGRTHRGTTMSDATVIGFYSKQFPGETSMMNSLLTKSNICKEVVDNADDIKFPGDFAQYVEGGGELPILPSDKPTTPSDKPTTPSAKSAPNVQLVMSNTSVVNSV